MTDALIQFHAPVPAQENPERPWERQPFDDTEDKWKAYRAYLMMPHPRSVQRAAEAVQTSLNQARTWSKANHWVLRVEAFDAALQGRWLTKVQEVVEINAENYGEKHGTILARGTELALREVEKYVEASRENSGIGLVSVSELNKLIENMIKLGRLVGGESTENVAHEFDASKLSITEAKQLKQLNEKARVKP